MTLAPHTALRVAAMVALAAGLGIWSARLLAPTPAAMPPTLSAPLPAQMDVGPVTAWFGAVPTARSMRVAVSGIIATGSRGVAILSVDGGPPRAWSVGDSANGMRLRAVHPDEVVLDQGGVDVRVALPRQAMPEGSGIVRVPR